MDIPASDVMPYVIVIAFLTLLMVSLLCTFIYHTIKNPKEPWKLIAVVVFSLLICGVIWVGRAWALDTAPTLAHGLISAADERHEYLTGTVVNLELTGSRYEYIAHLTVRDEQGTEWRVTTSLRNGLPVESLKAGVRVRFPRRYFITKSVSLTRAKVIWKNYFDETKTGSPPLTFLED